jgi:hypothetical protein
LKAIKGYKDDSEGNLLRGEYYCVSEDKVQKRAFVIVIRNFVLCYDRTGELKLAEKSA